MKDDVKLSCLIIEDEPIAAEVLEDYVQQVPFLELKGVCTDALFALDRLREEPIDVIFLDIHLPKLKGLDLLKILKHPPQTILTTAYHQYALDAFEADVVDYLMKPIEFSRFMKAVNKLKRQAVPAQRPAPLAISETSGQRPFRFFNVNKKMVRVFYDEVYFIESLKDYSRIWLQGDSLVTRGQIGEMEDLFRDHGFLRIHLRIKIRNFAQTQNETFTYFSF
ncbi:LytR/AlgR family response regulator transcription factor [Flavilitoribacter nigricans]|uniref:DNA-binding response regulator n=1 Tax=Flavilitoribacter nigricans (strain ATCC 23147 / DSM 23189 / NBRC 102662 / NCIMB 1420 / SS-2) TaxID=1122177 RepID=A0A2D0N229_FLAN2|nr:response regulator transcription factor [Flavilitoribacter nigricans]PHN02470.1 DNA-binding response regulator [Flavilitoribacter nigricans DSM 23189 = NBRC 102662]